jgi:hypothetical protein
VTTVSTGRRRCGVARVRLGRTGGDESTTTIVGEDGIACARTTGERLDGGGSTRLTHGHRRFSNTRCVAAVASSRGTTEREKGRAGGEAAAESERGGDDRPQGRGERG